MSDKGSLALAYAIKRHNMKKMAKGGFVGDSDKETFNNLEKSYHRSGAGRDDPSGTNVDKRSRSYGDQMIMQRARADRISDLPSKSGMADAKGYYSSGGIVKAIMAKKMNQGGEVEVPEYYDEDFLSDEEDSSAINLTYPDPEGKEETEGVEEPKMRMKKLLDRIMRG